MAIIGNGITTGAAGLDEMITVSDIQPTVPSNKVWVKDTSTDLDIPSMEDLEHSIAAAYSSSATYSVGAYVLYNGQLYKCTTAIATAEEWTAAHWTSTSVGAELLAILAAIQS